MHRVSSSTTFAFTSHKAKVKSLLVKHIISKVKGRMAIWKQPGGANRETGGLYVMFDHAATVTDWTQNGVSQTKYQSALGSRLG